MDEKNKNEGVSVKELEGYAKKHQHEIFFCALFILATIFTLVFWGATLSIFLTGIGAIIGVLLAEQIHQFAQKMAGIAMSKAGTMQLIIGLVALIVAIFLAPLVFLIVGLHGGKSMMRRARKASTHKEP